MTFNNILEVAVFTSIIASHQFSLNNRNRDDHMIIEAELVRCNYGSEYGNFKDIVKGHLDMFDMSK